MKREVSAHLALVEDDYRRRGLSHDEAHRAALRAVGGSDTAKEVHRDTRSFRWLEHLRRDVSLAIRLAVRYRGFSVAAVLTLAVGIGATTAIFAQANAIFLTPLPVDRPQDLRILSWTSPRRAFANGRLMQRIWDQWLAEGHHIETFLYAAFRQIADHDSGFADVACWRRGSTNSVIYGPLTLQYVSAGYFSTVGVRAQLGRVLDSQDQASGPAAAVVISHRFWRRAFGSDSNIVGRTLDLEPGRFVIVGVTPPGFFGVALAAAPDITAPLAVQPARPPDDWLGCNIVARVGSNVGEEQARARTEALVVQSILAAPPREAYDPPRVWLTNAEHGDDDLRRVITPSLRLLMTITAAVFLVACTNVAGLFLARSGSRSRELATRLAVGATSSRLVQQLLTEYFLVSMIGVALGIALTYAAMPILPRLMMTFIGRDGLAIEPSPDARVLGFAVALGLLNGLVFGLIPAWVTVRRHARLAARASATGLTPRATASRLLLATQVGVSMVLLVAAGLCVRSLVNLRAVPLGYEPRGLVFVTLNATPEQTGYVGAMLERLRGLPGVRSATASQYPLFAVAERSLPLCVPDFISDDPNHRFVDGDQVAPRFFETWGIDLLEGRDFEPTDATRRHVIVNRSFASTFYPNGGALGRTLGYGPKCTGFEQTIIGIVADSTNQPRDTGRPMVYAPYRRNVGFATFAVRVDDTTAFIPTLRTTLLENQSSLRGEISTGVAYRDRQTSRERLVTGFLTLFGAVGLLLSCVGLYGALAYTVSKRRSELGVRLALGAARGAIIRLVMRESVLPVASGIAVAVALSTMVAPLVQEMLFEVSTLDPLAIVGAVTILVATASLASALPAVRASRIDPAVVLRHE